MGWVTPRDWTGITDDIVTGSMLNVDIRDNLNVLSTHTHTGAAGMGSATLNALTLTNIATATFADQSANPDAAGELQRNGNNLLWYGSSAVNLTQGDASAGTASLRTLGTTSVKAAAGNHTHTIRQESASTKDYTAGDSGTNIGTDSGTQVVIADSAIDCASTANAVVIVCTWNLSAVTAGANVRMAIKIASGSELANETVTASDSGTYPNMQLHTLGVLTLPASTSSVTYEATASPANATANSKTVWATVQCSEVTIIPA